MVRVRVSGQKSVGGVRVSPPHQAGSLTGAVGRVRTAPGSMAGETAKAAVSKQSSPDAARWLMSTLPPCDQPAAYRAEAGWRARRWARTSATSAWQAAE